MPSGVLIDITGCLFKKDRNHFFPASDFSWLNGCFKPFLIANEKPCVLCPHVSVHSIFGP